MRGFFLELKNRGVLKAAVAYLFVGWLLLEVGHLVFQVLSLPDDALRWLFALITIGFIPFIFLAWQTRFLAPQSPSEHTTPHEMLLTGIVFGVIAVVALGIGIGVRYSAFRHPRVADADATTHSTQAKDHSRPISTTADFRPPEHSVAVLAFDNMSGNTQNNQLTDGLSEEILQALAHVRELQVAARTSSFSFKGTHADIPTVGRRLNVSNVLEGSVRQDGDRIRVTVQLIKAATGYHLWSENYDRTLANIIELQTEIAAKVADALEVKIFGNLHEKLAPGGTLNTKAQEAFYQGRAGERLQSAASLRAGLKALDEAIALDPNYANAHALRGDVLSQLSGEWTSDPEERQRLNAEALAAVRKAVELAPTSGFAQGELGRVLSATTANYAAIEAAYRRSMEVDPGTSSTLIGYASFAILLGRADALTAVKRAVQLDPLNAGALANLGSVQYNLGKHEEARTSFREALRLRDNPVMRSGAGYNELAAGNPAAALTFCRDPEFLYDQWCLAMAYHQLGRKKEAQAMLQKSVASQGDAAAYQYAEIYAQWGQPDQAIKWLDKAFELRDPGLLQMKMDPLLKPIRRLPRFQAILASLNLPP